MAVIVAPADRVAAVRAAAAGPGMLPLQERPSYQFRKQRIFTRGRYDGDTSIAAPPPAEPAATAQPPEGGGPTDT